MEENCYSLDATRTLYFDFLERQKEIGLIVIEHEGDEDVKTVDWVSNYINNDIKDIVILGDDGFEVVIHSGDVYKISEF
jgi:hypothetical protein